MGTSAGGCEVAITGTKLPFMTTDGLVNHLPNISENTLTAGTLMAGSVVIDSTDVIPTDADCTIFSTYRQLALLRSPQVDLFRS